MSVFFTTPDNARNRLTSLVDCSLIAVPEIMHTSVSHFVLGTYWNARRIVVIGGYGYRKTFFEKSVPYRSI